MTSRPNPRMRSLRIAHALVADELNRVVSTWLEPYTVDDLVGSSKPYFRILRSVHRSLDDRVVIPLQAELRQVRPWWGRRSTELG